MSEVWVLVGGVAFQTIPVARDITAIRCAVTTVAASLRAEGKYMKGWWLIAVFPDGRCPEARVPGGEHVSATEVADLMVREGVDGEGRPLVLPNGIGFNCVTVEHLQVQRLCTQVIGEGRKWPWLVLKPNGWGRDWSVGG
jgi:homocysteine S-methyltransferase